MESRKITIVSSGSQSRKEIMSAATTLAELKRDLNAAQISYDGMTFMEGYTKTELKADDSVLPTNVPTKNGKTTNELVFMLTAPQKKIKSGAMDRKECYAFMRNHPEVAKAFSVKFGKNYTNGSTADLAAFIAAKTKKNPVQVVKAPKGAVKCTCSEKIIENAKAFAAELYRKDAISEANFTALVAVLNGSTKESVTSSLSNDDINKMFDFVEQ